MADEGGPVEGSGRGAGATRPKALAFYLPQFHPIPENDAWWGKGFTEWNNVTRARPVFPGHYQPHVPGELGYYDLRVPEVRQAQADLAREHGIHGFVYYHYWFNGKQLLERPFDEVLASGEPDFPFALCWANEEWTRNWDARTGALLMPQEFSEQDDLAHIRWLLDAFGDRRYLAIGDRPLMLVYRPELLPEPKRTFDIWRTEAQRAGLPDLYLCYVESHGPPQGGPSAFGMDASVRFMPNQDQQVFVPVEGTRGNRLIDYPSAAESHLRRDPPDWKVFPSVMVSWDNTARRPYGATIFDGATPEAYEQWLRKTVELVADVPEEENYLFILAWNEWAEGNHLEPDRRYGRAWLEATRSVLLPGAVDRSAADAEDGAAGATDTVEEPVGHHQGHPLANAAGLVDYLLDDRSSVVVDVGVPDPDPSAGAAVSELGFTYRPLGVAAGATTEAVCGALDDVDHVGALLLLDVLQHRAEPQELLVGLSRWALDHDEPMLVVSVPNVAHFDVALRLLCGSWIPTGSGLLDSSAVRFFAEGTLTRLVERCGWEIVARDDLAAVRSDQFDDALNDEVPIELLGALRVLARAGSTSSSVQQFVWALRPVPVGTPPASFLDATQPADTDDAPLGDLDEVRALPRLGRPAGQRGEPSGVRGGRGAPRPGRRRRGRRAARRRRRSRTGGGLEAAGDPGVLQESTPGGHVQAGLRMGALTGR